MLQLFMSQTCAVAGIFDLTSSHFMCTDPWQATRSQNTKVLRVTCSLVSYNPGTLRRN